MIARAPTDRRAAYLARETAISMVINAVLSLAFFVLLIGLPSMVPVAGRGGYAFDFVPQSFMIALMSTLVPGFITAARIRGGAIAGQPERHGAIVRRSVLTAILSALAGAAIAGALLAAGMATVPLAPALAAKILYGVVLASVVTPIGLARALRMTELA